MELTTLTYIVVGASFALYIGIAIWSRASNTSDFYVAGKHVHPVANGMATAADWMSAASFISMAGLIAYLGYDGSVYLMGWTGGYVLLALLLAPYLRKFGKFTVPEFIGERYDSRAARIVAVICLIVISFTYVAGQMRGVGIVFSRFLEVPIGAGLVIGMGVVFTYAVLGGMKGITNTQIAQYCVLDLRLYRSRGFHRAADYGHADPADCLRQHGAGRVGVAAGEARSGGHRAGLSRIHIGHEGRLRCVLHHDGADDRYRRVAPRHRAFLHRAQGPRRPLFGRLGAALHRHPLPDCARRRLHGAAEPDGDDPDRTCRRRGQQPALRGSA